MNPLDFFRPKWRHSNWEVRKATIETLTDQALLAEIVKSDRMSAVRSAAVSKLSNNALLSEIIEGTKDWNVRLAAIGRLTDQTMIARIAKTCDEKPLRQAAVAKLIDQALITEIANADKDPEVRRSAVARFDDQTALVQIAFSGRDADLKQAAILRLTAIFAPEKLPEEIRFKAYILVGDRTQPPIDLVGAVRMGTRFLPLLEEILLAFEPTALQGARGREYTQGTQIFTNALEVYDRLGGIPSGKLRRKLAQLAFDDEARNTNERDKAKAQQILQRGPGTGTDDRDIAWIGGTSRNRQTEAIRACFARAARGDIPADRRVDFVEALMTVAQSPGRNQIGAIECLGVFRSDARAALPVLESAIAAARRPLTRADFKEQEQFLGGRLTPEIINQFGKPCDPEALQAAHEAIRRICEEEAKPARAPTA